VSSAPLDRYEAAMVETMRAKKRSHRDIALALDHMRYASRGLRGASDDRRSEHLSRAADVLIGRGASRV
jgi:hypothetical protein